MALDHNHMLFYVCNWCDWTEPVWCNLDIEAPMSLLCPECGKVTRKDTSLSEHLAGFDCPAGHARFVDGGVDAAIAKLGRRRESALLGARVCKDYKKEHEVDINAYYDDQIRQVHEGTHPAFPPGYVVRIREELPHG